MEKILYPEQHGFCRNRSIQTATVPILEAIHDAEKYGRPLQLLSIDLKAAFDTISPQVIYDVMENEKFPPTYIDALQGLTATGKARVYVNGITGPERDVVCGNGQGNPPSASTFNIGSDPVLRAVNNIACRFRYTFSNGKRLPSFGFADDHLHGLKIDNAQQVMDILEVYRKYREVSGLTVSLSKTSILGINTDPEILHEVARLTGVQVVTGFKYLGVQLRASYQGSIQASYDTVCEGITAKCNRIYASKVDLFHRRQLIKTVVVPSYNHVFMAFGPPCEDTCKKLDAEIIKLFWTRKNNGEVKNGRRLVAKNRLRASYDMGGLQIDFSTETAKGLMLNGLQRLKRQGSLPVGERNFMYQLLEEWLREINILSLDELYRVAGPKIWLKVGNKMQEKSLYFSGMCKAIANMLELNEKSKDGWASASIAGHGAIQDIFRITAADGITLETFGLTYVGQLWGKDDITGRIDGSADVRYPDNMSLNHGGLITKCKNLRHNLRRNMNAGTVLIGSFSQTTANIKYSGLYRKLCREALDASMPGPPSFFTRRKDGIPVPALDRFMTGYRNLFKMDISSKTLENSFLVMNRQVWTNEKSFLSGQGRAEGRLDDNCKLCGRKENTMHLLFECESYSEPLWTLLEKTINDAIGLEEPAGGYVNIRMHAFLVLYNITTGIPGKYCKIIMIVIQEIKRNIIFRRYQRETANAGGVTIYPRERLLAHLSITIRKIFNLRKYCGKSNTFLEAMQMAISNMQ